MLFLAGLALAKPVKEPLPPRSVASVTAGGITATRPAIESEEEPEPLRSGASDIEYERYQRAEWYRQHWVTAAKNIDTAVGWLLPLVEHCYAGKPAARATVRMAVSEKAIVTRVQPARDADPALAACLVQTFHKQPIPAVTYRGEIVVDYTFDAPAGLTTPAQPDPIDLDLGVGSIAYGQAADALYSARITQEKYGVYFYQAEFDSEMQLYGVPVSTVEYLIGPDGFFAAMFRFTGDANAYAVRQGLKGRYGNPHWDPATKSFYWRGERHMIGTLQDIDSHFLIVTYLHMEKGRKSGMVSRLPGDKGDIAVTGTLPRILRD